MGRIPGRSVGGKDSMSTSRGKGALKPGSPPRKREKATGENVAPEKHFAKGACRQPSAEIFNNYHRASSRTVSQSGVVGNEQATVASESTQLSRKNELARHKEAGRGTAHGKCAHQKGSSVEDEAAKQWSEISEVEDTIVEKRVVNDVKIRKPVRHHDGLSRDVTSFACPGQGKAAGIRECSTLSRFSTSEQPRRRRNDALRSHSLNSSSGNDFCPSFAFSESSSSSSCKSDAAAIAKGCSSPAAFINTELKAAGVCEGLIDSESPQPEVFARKLGASELPPDGGKCELSKAVHSNLHRRELVEEDFLEFNFLEGRLVDCQASRGTTTENISGCCRSEDIKSEEKSRLSIQLCDENVSNLELPSSAFYPVRQSCSENSNDADNRRSIERTAQLQNVAFQTQIHELCQHPDSQTPGNDHDFQSAPFEADVDVDTVLLKSDLQPRRRPSSSFSDVPLCEDFIFPRGFSPDQDEDVFSFQSPRLWSDSSEKFKSSLSRSPASIVKKGGVASDDYNDTDMFHVQSKGDAVTDLWDIPVMDEPVLASQTFSHQHVWKTRKVSFSDAKHSEALNESAGKAFSELLRPGTGKSQRPATPRSSSKIMHSERPDEPIRKAHSELLWASGLSESQIPVFSSSKTHWDWRSKSVGAKAGLKTAVRNLEAAFAGSRSTSVPKSRLQNSHKDLKTESSRFLNRVFASPMRARHKHAETFKPVEIMTCLDDQFLRRNQSMRWSLRESKPLAFSHKRLAVDFYSDSTMENAQVNQFARPPLAVGYGNRNSNLEVSCKPFLPPSRSVRCLPAPKAEVGSVSPVSHTLKLTNSSSNRCDVTSSSMIQGSVQCILTEGVPCYTLTIDDSDEMLLARAWMPEIQSSREGWKWTYTFHSGRSKGKGKGTIGWRSWAKKDKTASELAGKMKVSSVLCAEVTPTGDVTHSVVSEFVLFDGRAEDTVRCQSSRIWALENKLTASSMGESLVSGSYAPSDSTSPSSFSRMQTPEKRISTASITSSSVESDTMSPRPQLFSPIKLTKGHRPSFSFDVWSETELTDFDVGPLISRPSHMELAAMIIRVKAPEHEQVPEMGDCDSRKNAWGWGLSFLDSGSDSEIGTGIHSVHRTLPRSSVDGQTIVRHGTIPAGNGFNSSSSMSSFDEQSSRIGMLFNSMKSDVATPSCALPRNSSRKPEDFGRRSFQRAESVTILLPVGDHSLPNGESRGPSSLIERWRSGGKCDCGGWDLGCGLCVLSNERCSKTRYFSIQSRLQTKPLNIFSQGSREVFLSLSALQQDCFTLIFQSDLSPLQAFASAVAILHSKEAPLPAPETSVSSADTPLSIASSALQVVEQILDLKTNLH